MKTLSAKAAAAPGSLAVINAALRGTGVELVRGQGYHYYVYDNGGHLYETYSRYLCYTNQISNGDWVQGGLDFAHRVTATATAPTAPAAPAAAAVDSSYTYNVQQALAGLNQANDRLARARTPDGIQHAITRHDKALSLYARAIKTGKPILTLTRDQMQACRCSYKFGKFCAYLPNPEYVVARADRLEDLQDLFEISGGGIKFNAVLGDLDQSAADRISALILVKP